MYAILQRGIATGYFLIPKWRSANTEDRILGDFEENAQEPTVRFNIQPARQSTGFSDFQSNNASVGTY
jgi:hypothetical protein